MSGQPTLHQFQSLDRLVVRLRDDFQSGGHDFVLLYAYNGTGKTRVSMEFKDAGKRKNGGAPDTLYFNAFTEDLFVWDNDLQAAATPLQVWYEENSADIADFEKQMRRKVHYVIQPDHLWASIAKLARDQSGELLNTLRDAFKYIENDSFQSTFQGLFSEINLSSEKLGKAHAEKNRRLCDIIKEIANGLAEFSSDIDALGDAYEYLIGQFAAGSGKKAGEFYTPQQISTILSRVVTLDSQEPRAGKVPHLGTVFDFACGSGSLLLNVRKQMAGINRKGRERMVDAEIMMS